MHMCWSLLLITFQALQLQQYFSLQFFSLQTRQVYMESKIWKELFLKICESNTKYLRLKSPKYKAKLNLQKNYIIYGNKTIKSPSELLKSNEIIKKYSALSAFLPFTFLSSDPKKEVVIFGPAWDRAYLVPFWPKVFFGLKMQFHNFLLYKKA